MVISKKGIFFTVAILASLGFSMNYAYAGWVESVKEAFIKPQKTEVKINGQTVKILWPTYLFNIRVVSPNGGEVWKKGETHQVTWEIDQAKVEQWMNEFRNQNSGLNSSIAPVNLQVLAFLVREKGPVPRSNIEQLGIYKGYLPSKGIFVGRADLFAKTMNWQIPDYIPVGDDYKIKLIATWAMDPMPLVLGQEDVKPVYFPKAIGDESDKVFSIAAGTSVSPSPTPSPTPIDTQELLRQIESLRNEIAAMRENLTRMNSVLGRLMDIIGKIR